MSEPQRPEDPQPVPLRQSDPEKYAYLRAEATAPYRGLRQFIYVAFGASGFVGGIFFLAQFLAGRDVDSALPNLALQVGVVALMVTLWRWDQRSKDKAISAIRKRERQRNS
ncbi:DUF3493 domain-containing protein [Alkalinema pantanalense CENA528]|uniref:DUF3493 domain-containing protein n=1 Tax=Alkalinema pantanalense TaxID=1620705 RepID=UPI003D6F82AD